MGRIHGLHFQKLRRGLLLLQGHFIKLLFNDDIAYDGQLPGCHASSLLSKLFQRHLFRCISRSRPLRTNEHAACQCLFQI